MNIRTRTIIFLLSALCAAVIAALSLMRLTVPTFAEWYSGLSPALLDRVVDGFAASLIGLLTGAVGVVVSLLLLAHNAETRASERGGARARARAAGPASVDASATAGHVASTSMRTSTSAARAPVPPVVGALAVMVAIAAVLLVPGDVIPVAGYTFAMVAMGILVTGAVLLTIRHPLPGIAVLAAFAGVIVFFTVRVDDPTLLLSLFASLGAELPQLAVTAAYLALAAGVALSAIGDGRARGAVGRWVLAHRIAITVVAAVCSVPYVFVRASWLTPWPLLSPGSDVLAANPAVLATGLSLGFAMLAGGLLTLGLVRPWGERFPRWFAAVGGRPVPVGLPVIAAMTVAVLFTAGGVGMVVQAFAGQFGALGAVAVVEIVAVFPFWLWGPLLALAAWGYAMHRADRQAVDAAAYASTAGRVSATMSPHTLAQLDAWESREA
ncbi:hypothetical protein [Microbacterium sp. H1-D42]|uniref:hypothetical protein n=1 Tax=Microbacterium sp. H1-D42 TaxID=2925844 RepID=UPI001F53161E|nr:hypothetical protein [Microbacterium sp. H1-D42]UNK71152.1 hypothetical protein MNR00_01510 [Microbacterium sp. H1-D42]